MKRVRQWISLFLVTSILGIWTQTTVKAQATQEISTTHACPTMTVTAPKTQTGNLLSKTPYEWTITTSQVLSSTTWLARVVIVNQNDPRDAESINFENVISRKYNPYVHTGFTLVKSFVGTGTYNISVLYLESGYSGCTLQNKHTVTVIPSRQVHLAHIQSSTASEVEKE